MIKFYIGLIEFDMFKLKNDDAFICSQASISINKSIQLSSFLKVLLLL